jgi:hypothetical protein
VTAAELTTWEDSEVELLCGQFFARGCVCSGELTIICPVCQFDYTHSQRVYTRPGTDEYEYKGPREGTVEDRSRGTAGRRGAIVIEFSGECGHSFDLVLTQHKGQEYLLLTPNPDRPCGFVDEGIADVDEDDIDEEEYGPLDYGELPLFGMKAEHSQYGRGTVVCDESDSGHLWVWFSHGEKLCPLDSLQLWESTLSPHERENLRASHRRYRQQKGFAK